jgi:hypothetical protein
MTFRRKISARLRARALGGPSARLVRLAEAHAGLFHHLRALNCMQTGSDARLPYVSFHDDGCECASDRSNRVPCFEVQRGRLHFGSRLGPPLVMAWILWPNLVLSYCHTHTLLGVSAILWLHWRYRRACLSKWLTRKGLPWSRYFQVSYAEIVTHRDHDLQATIEHKDLVVEAADTIAILTISLKSNELITHANDHFDCKSPSFSNAAP